MKGPVPGREPGKLPFVRHRDDVFHVAMDPLVVAAAEAGSGRRGLCRITVQPLCDVVMKILLRPEHPGESLALNAAEILVRDLALQRRIKGVRLGFAQIEGLLEISEGCGRRLAQTQPDPDGGAGARRDGATVDTGRLCAFAA